MAFFGLESRDSQRRRLLNRKTNRFEAVKDEDYEHADQRGSLYHSMDIPTRRVVFWMYQMIRSCGDKETEKLFRRLPSRKFRNVKNSARAKLALLDAAVSLKDLSALPGLRLEKLTGDRSGQHSIRVNDQYRLCFVWRDGDAFDVEITDYH